jgi:hypothetical protein
MVEQHAHGDVAIARVRHREFRNVPEHGSVEFHFAFMSIRIATAANILLTEPMLKRVFRSTARFCARSATPMVSEYANAPRSMMATVTPLPWPEVIAFHAVSRAFAIVFVKSGRGATCALAYGWRVSTRRLAQVTSRRRVRFIARVSTI